VGPARKADNLTAICEPTVWKMWKPRHLATLGLPRPVTGIALPLFFYIDVLESSTKVSIDSICRSGAYVNSSHVLLSLFLWNENLKPQDLCLRHIWTPNVKSEKYSDAWRRLSKDISRAHARESQNTAWTSHLHTIFIYGGQHWSNWPDGSSVSQV
jgi:hypothetical protein